MPDDKDAARTCPAARPTGCLAPAGHDPGDACWGSGGRSGVDAGWRAQLDRPATSVATDANGAVLGVFAYALRPKDARGVILWLHCRENEMVARTLLDHAATEMGSRPLDAFHFTSVLTPGLEALRDAKTRIYGLACGFSRMAMQRSGTC
ncbi:hypothetical protein AB0M41_38385 [Streptomyces sp. NPDC051896]|uniref:hypothetical protein n=1 Tax=Streptomyces sp. NPDC051896 TaxID=3155416 RepID=UPI00343AD3C8